MASPRGGELQPGNPATLQLAVIDLANPRSPSVVGRMDLSGGSGLAARGDMVYVAAGVAGLAIVDVSRPSAPRPLGSVNTPGSAKAVAVGLQHAFVADSDSIQVVNVSDSARPVRVGSLGVSASAVALAGDRLYALGGQELKILDVSDATRPRLLARYPAAEAAAVAAIGDRVFLIDPSGPATDPRARVKVLDVANPSAPRETGEIGIPGQGGALATDGEHVYASDGASALAVLGSQGE